MGRFYKYIFIVLIYRNGEDLYDLDKSLKGKFDNYHIIVVNSFYDRDSEQKIQKIASDIAGSFVSVENKGYGSGNNAGIQYALQKFSFDYLIISNSDIIVQSFNPEEMPKKNVIIGPRIVTITGKAQNPYWDRKRKCIEYLIYLGHKKQSGFFMYLGQGLNRFFRELFLLKVKYNKGKERIYAVHGSCVVFSIDVIEKLFPVYDPNMFLFYEEAFLARKAEKYCVDVIYYPQFQVLHKEDGSTKGLNVDLSKHATHSYLYYYNLAYGKKGS